MTTHITADAFVRKLLERPTDATARLVFADWLEETGDKRNTAWAYYIRLRTEADRYPHNSRERAELERQAAGYTKHIRAELALPAAKFIGYPKSLLQLLPAPNITVRLDGFDPPRAVVEFLPESVARENILFPLDHQPGTLLLAGAEPWNADTLQKLQFILNRDIVLVRADLDDLLDAINRSYGQTETISIDSAPLLYAPLPEPEPTDPQVVQAADALLHWLPDATDRVRVESGEYFARLFFHNEGRWVEQIGIGQHLVRPLAAQLALRAGVGTAPLYATATDYEVTGSFEFEVLANRLRVQLYVIESNNGPDIELFIDEIQSH